MRITSVSSRKLKYFWTGNKQQESNNYVKQLYVNVVYLKSFFRGMFNFAFRKSFEYYYVPFFITNVEGDIKFGNEYNSINFGIWLAISNLVLCHSENKCNSVTGNTLYIMKQKSYRYAGLTYKIWGTRCYSWLRHCVTSRKASGSIPDGVT